MKFDLHTHHFRCGHADGNIRDYVEAALEAGLQVIGISDHTPILARKRTGRFRASPWANRSFSIMCGKCLI